MRARPAGAGPGAGRAALSPHPRLRRYPVIVRRFELRLGSGGRGRFRGGDGVIRELLFREEALLSVLTERRAFQPYGLHGEQPCPPSPPSAPSGRRPCLPTSSCVPPSLVSSRRGRARGAGPKPADTQGRPHGESGGKDVGARVPRGKDCTPSFLHPAHRPRPPHSTGSECSCKEPETL